jgi:protein subunit release factor B
VAHARREDVVVTFVKAGGPGGQHRNKRETGVRLLHVPTGITVGATERRERTRNLELAWERLEAALARRARRPKPRKKTRPTRAANERRLAQKTRRGKVKTLRRPGKDRDPG